MNQLVEGGLDYQTRQDVFQVLLVALKRAELSIFQNAKIDTSKLMRKN